MPENLVSVMPDKTLLPILLRASLDRSSYEPSALQNARTICDTNSTPIPMHYTKSKHYIEIIIVICSCKIWNSQSKYCSVYLQQPN